MTYRHIILTIIVLFLVACTPAKPDQIDIGGLFHLTGPGAFWGEGEKNGALLAIEEINAQGGINGITLNIIIEDGKTDFKDTVNAIHKLADADKISIIVGPTWFGQVASPLADQKKILIISPSAGTIPEPSPYFFDLWPTERQEIISEIQYMKENDIQKVAIIFSLNDWSQSMKDNFIDEANLQGIEIIKIFSTNPDETDFRTIITQIKTLDIDSVYAPFAFYPSQGEFSKQAKILGMDIPLYSSSGTENPILLGTYPEIEGTIYPYPVKGPGEREFSKKYTEKYGIPPSPPAAYAYDTIKLITQALDEGKTTPEEIANFLRDIDEYQGVSNIISFDENGRVTQKNHIMKIVKDGEFEYS